LEQVKAEVLGIAEHLKVFLKPETKFYFFGSWSSGTNKLDSDIDIRIIYATWEEVGIFERFAHEQEV